MPNIDVLEANETMLNGMSNFINEKQWEDLLLQRCNIEAKDWEAKLLSPEFIIKYKNSLAFDCFTLYLVLAWKKKNLTVDFMKRFWKYVDFIGNKEDVLLDHAAITGGDDSLSKVYSEMCDGTPVADIMLKNVPAFTMEQLDKRPFHYNGEQWRASLERMPAITKEFIEKYIHMMDFDKIMNNENLTKEQRVSLRDAFTEKVKIENKEVYMFPDGSILEGDNFECMRPGKAYYGNRNHFAVPEAEEAIKKLKARFPRALEDCAFPDNAAVMVDK